MLAPGSTRGLPPTAIVVPPHLQVALGEIGVIEDIRPGRSNPRIEQYHALTAAGAAVDDVSWCASYVGWCLEMAGIKSTRSKSAASYATWGEPCLDTVLRDGSWVYDPSTMFGAVALMAKFDKDAGGTGHVGFLMGVSGTDIFLCGGNQDNRVSIAVRKKANVVALRRAPKLAALLA